ncbi:MAG TPA: site-2 protease family protein, partial [Candidatus Nitrosotenuis sp.]|nr:site-2 protease family protein [Candidatus Nitrosotenuis sp.]
LLLAWVGSAALLEGRPLAVALGRVAFLAAIFTMVVLHEMGHALVARRYGIRTLDITLLPIGGLARLERPPEEPGQEIRIALAGPAVNLVLAGIFALARQVYPAEFLGHLVVINLSLGLFNLLPAFPMDGGRVLRALLALRTSFEAATEKAATLGQGLAMLLGLLGLVVNPLLLLVALFVFMGAVEEERAVQMRQSLGKQPVSRAMITDFRTLAPQDPLSRAVDHVLAGFQHDFPVVDQGQVVGVLTLDLLLRRLAEGGAHGTVAEAMQPCPGVATPGEPLAQVLPRLQEGTCATLPVVDQGRLVGLLTLENLGEFLMIQSALRRAPTS